MKSILLITLAYGQLLMATQSPTYEGADFSYEKSHSKASMKSELPKWVGKTCAVGGVSIATFALCTIQACFTPSSPYKPFIAAGVAGAATYAYFELIDNSE